MDNYTTMNSHNVKKITVQHMTNAYEGKFYQVVYVTALHHDGTNTSITLFDGGLGNMEKIEVEMLDDAISDKAKELLQAMAERSVEESGGV